MTNEEIFNSIKSMIVDQLDLNADSLDMVELVMAMEQEFDISIPDEVAEKVATVGDAVDYIKGLAE